MKTIINYQLLLLLCTLGNSTVQMCQPHSDIICCVQLHTLIIYCTGLLMPQVIKKRGRPKGHMLTTIGLPCKRAKMNCRKDGPVAFSRLHTSDKKKGQFINCWCKNAYQMPYLQQQSHQNSATTDFKSMSSSNVEHAADAVAELLHLILELR